MPPKSSAVLMKLPEGALPAVTTTWVTLLPDLNRKEEIIGASIAMPYNKAAWRHYEHMFRRKDLPFARRHEINELLSSGEMPPIDSGYQFVIDRRPEGQEDRYIPAKEYTQYFSERKVPVADTDHKQRQHDVGHMPSYQDIFRIAAFADVVQEAALASLDDDERCKQFTRAMDGFGDSMRNMLEDQYFQRDNANHMIGDVNSARRELYQLIELRSTGPKGIASTSEERAELFNTLWLTMGLAAQAEQAEAYARTHPIAHFSAHENFTVEYQLNVPSRPETDEDKLIYFDIKPEDLFLKAGAERMLQDYYRTKKNHAA